MASGNEQGGPGIGRVIVVASLLAAGGILYYMFRAPRIASDYTAMEPDYKAGSRLLVNLRSRNPAKGDVVFYAYDYMDEHHEQIGRIVAGPGEKVMLDQSNRRIWDMVKDRETGPSGELLGTIPEEKYFLVDNETQGEWADSRDFGLVGRSAIRGRVVAILPF